MTCQITEEELSSLWGYFPDGLPAEGLAKLHNVNTKYRPATAQERDDHILHILKRMHEQKIARSTPENLDAFESGWSENYELVKTQGVSLQTLKPKYVKPYSLVRFNGQFVVPENPYLIDDLLTIATTSAFASYLTQVENIYEYGCGSGRYIYELSCLFPEKQLTGLDWTVASQKILELVADSGRHVRGIRFDMLNPPSEITIKPRSAVVTVGAIEQLGDHYQSFLDYLLANRPEIVVHHEPIEEFYDQQNLFDYLAFLYHRWRGYLSGYWTALQNLEEQGKIQILTGHSLHFGDPYNEPLSLVVWRPL